MRLSLSAAGLGAGLVATVPGMAAAAPGKARGNALTGDPFTLGVASGDPWPDGFVLWTRWPPTASATYPTVRCRCPGRSPRTRPCAR